MTSLRRISAPAADPVSLSDAKAQLRVTHDLENDYITSLVSAAVSYVDGLGVLGRAMITQSWRQGEASPRGRVNLGMHTVQSLSAVKYFGADNVEQTATLSDFVLVSGDDWAYVELADGATWPTTFDRPDAVNFEYVAGYGDDASDVPQDVRHALLLLVAHWYQERVAVTEKAQMPIFAGFEYLLNNHRLSWYG